MSIERFRNQFTPICDSCGEEKLQAENSFPEARAAIRAAGWKTIKRTDGTYAHICKTCQTGGLDPAEKKVERTGDEKHSQ